MQEKKLRKHIAILDFGSQYTHLIARRIREFSVLAKIYPHDVSVKLLKNVWGVILSGGPQSVYEKNAPKFDPNIFKLKIPILGICYGHHLLAHYLGGEVKSGQEREYGKAKIKKIFVDVQEIQKKKLNILRNIRDDSVVWMSHGDSVLKLPDDFVRNAKTKNCDVVVMSSFEKKIFGVQFHPEVDHSEEGKKIIKNFIFSICGAKKNWNLDNFIFELKKDIKKQAKNKKVFCLVSGGVDSNVTFSLLSKTLGRDRVKGVYIDTGFMRQDETVEIKKKFVKAKFDNLIFFSAKDIFLKNLKNIVDPEEKRKIIGKTFLEVQKIISKNFNLKHSEFLLGQGTIYPDIIESGVANQADKIKTHHNRVNEIQKMIKKKLVIEPISDFYKFEVRKIGKILGLPNTLINCHPFPGPGLAIRILCQTKSNFQLIEKSFTKNTKLALEKMKKIAKKYDINFEILNIKSVGVQGDNRTYAYPVAIWGENNFSNLEKISVEITNSIPEINRVVLCLNSDLGDSLKSNKINKDFYLTEDRISFLQRIDQLVNKFVRREKLYNKIEQFPIVLAPILGKNGNESIILRPIKTRDFMTCNFFYMPFGLLNRLKKEIFNNFDLSYIFYDITNKPPGTTEWE